MKSRGFTLLELLVVMAIAAIVLGIGMPGLRQIYVNAVRKEASTNLFAALNRARSEAISLNATLGVSVCPRKASTAEPSCAQGSDWSQGWLVVELVESGSPVVIASYPAISSSLRFDAAPTTPVNFNANGRTTGVVDFRLCAAEDSVDSRSRYVRVRRSGGISLEDASTC